MKAIDYIRQKVAQTLNLDPPDEVFRPALDKAMYKALSQHDWPDDLFMVSLDWLAMVMCEYIQVDLLSIQRRKEMEEKSMERYDNSIKYNDLVYRTEITNVCDDFTADKALERLERAKKDFDRAKEIGARRIEEITAQMQAAEERYQKIAQPLQKELGAYMRHVDCRETKTRYSYQLLSGKVILKKPTQKLVPDRKALVEYLQESGMTDYLKLTPEPAWGEYKKRLKIVGDTVIDADTGEVVPAVAVENVPEELTWEV